MCLYSKQHEINDFEEELDEDTCGHGHIEEKKINDIDDEGMKDKSYTEMSCIEDETTTGGNTRRIS